MLISNAAFRDGESHYTSNLFLLHCNNESGSCHSYPQAVLLTRDHEIISIRTRLQCTRIRCFRTLFGSPKSVAPESWLKIKLRRQTFLKTSVPCSLHKDGLATTETGTKINNWKLKPVREREVCPWMELNLRDITERQPVINERMLSVYSNSCRHSAYVVVLCTICSYSKECGSYFGLDLL